MKKQLDEGCWISGQIRMEARSLEGAVASLEHILQEWNLFNNSIKLFIPLGDKNWIQLFFIAMFLFF